MALKPIEVENLEPTQIFIEETLPTLPDESYQVVYLAGSYKDAVSKLSELKHQTANRLSVWSIAWTETNSGYQPMAWAN